MHMPPRRPVDPPPGGAPADGIVLPQGTDLTYSTARAVLTQVERHRGDRTWSAADVDRWRQARRLVSRFELLGRVLRLVPAAGAVVGVMIIGALSAWTAADGLLVSRGASATTEATVGDAAGKPLPLWPQDVELTFTTGAGTQVEADAAVVDADALPSTVTVEYAVDEPYRVRVVGDPGPVRGVALSAAALVVTVVVAVGLSVAGPLRRRTALARARRTEPTRLAYVLDRETVPPGETATEGFALLFDDLGAPAFRLRVRGEGVGRAALTGTALVQGELRADAPVRCTLGDVVVRCHSPLLHLDPQEWLDELRDELEELHDDLEETPASPASPA